VAGQFNVDLVAAISNAVCPTLDQQPYSNTAPTCRGKRPKSFWLRYLFRSLLHYSWCPTFICGQYNRVQWNDFSGQ